MLSSVYQTEEGQHHSGESQSMREVLMKNGHTEFMPAQIEGVNKAGRMRTGSMCRLHKIMNFESLLATSKATAFIRTIGTFNKDTAFTQVERDALHLTGLLPPAIETIEEQVDRCLTQLRRKENDLDKNIFLASLCSQNETLFYRLVMDNLTECMPLIYTPTVGEVCQKFSQLFRSNLTRGMYLTLNDKGRIATILDNWVHPKVDIVVVTDGSRILGLGDLGLNGMGIPIGKLHLYVAGGGFHPSRTLPIVIDVGTSNVALRSEPSYLGLRVDRCSEGDYYALLDEFMMAIKEKWPTVLVQFEDFSNNHCFDILARYRHRQLCFNDDIQGTGAVILAGFINACKLVNIPMAEQRIVFFGAGSAAIGVADQIVDMLCELGIPRKEARRRFWFVDSKGLVTQHRLRAQANPSQDYKEPYARDDIDPEIQCTSLLETVHLVKPTGLIGLSGIANAFTEEVLSAMKMYSTSPIIFALSNPTKNAECTFENAIRCTNGSAVFAAGSPFDDVMFNNRRFCSSQGNNMYVFPGLGLGASLAKAKEITNTMVLTAAKTLSACASVEFIHSKRMLYPKLSEIRSISLRIAVAVIEQAFLEGVATITRPDYPLDEFVQNSMYYPEYFS